MRFADQQDIGHGFRDFHFRRDEKCRMLTEIQTRWFPRITFSARRKISERESLMTEHVGTAAAAEDAEDAIDNPSAVVL